MGAIPRGFESRLLRLRVIFLNSWFGKAGKPFFDFIKKESSRTDIFCFMEVSPDLYSKLASILKNFSVFYEKGSLVGFPAIICGQAIFVAKKMKIGKRGKISLYHQSIRDVGFLQFSEIGFRQKKIWLGSVHGKTLPGDKLDTPIRLKQSEKIIKFFANKSGLKIIGGDFNLDPATKSIEMFEAAGYINLIKKFGIKSTRNKISWDQFKNASGYIKQYFADYVFVSKDVKVTVFEVPYIEISDHLPQILDFEI